MIQRQPHIALRLLMAVLCYCAVHQHASSQQKIVQSNTDSSSLPKQQSVLTPKYAVQIGAYKFPDKVQYVSDLANERFHTTLLTVKDPETELIKVYVGNFTTKDAARKFRDMMVRTYPSDYNDAWVSELPRK